MKKLPRPNEKILICKRREVVVVVDKTRVLSNNNYGAVFTGSTNDIALNCCLTTYTKDRDEELSFLKDERVNRKVARPRLLVDTLRTRFYHGEYTILFQLLQHNHYCKH